VRAVWSFWSKPFLAGTGWSWGSPFHHFLAWGLSLRLARAHYPETLLVTDTPGRALLADALGLPFGSVSTALDQLADADPALWAVGKLVAYSLQDAPFVHIDGDVFLWRPLPAAVAGAPAFAQHPEEFPAGKHGGPRDVEEAFARAGLGLPAEWTWARSLSADRFREANHGFFGVLDEAFARYYARLALGLALNRAHADAWASIPHRGAVNATIEQFLFAACADFHRFAPASPHRGLRVRYLFPSAEQAYDPARARQQGYTHLLGDAKRHPATLARLAARVRDEDPVFYARCAAVSGDLASAGGGPS
jgi:hypothetical protein